MKTALILILLASLSFASEKTVSMNFDGVDMEVFLQWFAARSNKRIIYSHLRSALAQKKIYLIAPDPIPESAVEKICMSLLENNGYTLVKSGRSNSEVCKLVETSKASSQPIALYSPKDTEKMEGDYYVSQLVLIEHLKAEHVLSSIQQAKLLDAGNIVEIKGANALIISDFLPNVTRILKIIRMIDVPPPQVATEFVTLKNARADEVARKLGELYQNRARETSQYHTASPSPSIIADTRTNSLTLRGSLDDLREIQDLIARYDVEIRGSAIEARIYRLKHVPPEKILPTLREFLKTPLFAGNRTNPQVRTSQTDEEISVIANEYAGSLLIIAPTSAHPIITDILEKLDVRRPQVLIEAVICEFTPSDVLNFGIELMKLDKVADADGHTLAHAVSSFGLSSIVDQVGGPVTPENPGTPAGRELAPGGGLTAFITKDKASNLPFLIKALQSVTHTEVLSVPRILTDDGEKAEIRVEQEEPVTSTNALNTSTTTTSFKEFVSAGTSLIITPHIVHDDSLRLEIEQNIEAFVGSSPSIGVPPPRSSRSLKTIVTIPNGQTVILGGLCGRREVETVDKIPILGDIPLLGLLFQNRSRSVSKTDLYIFIKPQILHHPEFEDLKEISTQTKERVKRLHGIPIDNPQEKLEQDR